MANFSRVQVDIAPGSTVRRVTASPDSGLQAVFLDGAEKEILKGMTPKRVTTPPKGILVDKQVGTALDSELTPVCYLINGELVCW